MILKLIFPHPTNPGFLLFWVFHKILRWIRVVSGPALSVHGRRLSCRPFPAVVFWGAYKVYFFAVIYTITELLERVAFRRSKPQRGRSVFFIQGTFHFRPERNGLVFRRMRMSFQSGSPFYLWISGPNPLFSLLSFQEAVGLYNTSSCF